MIASATIPVVTDTASAATAGGTANSSVSAGNSACAEYIETKVVSPAANSATVTARYSRVPRVGRTSRTVASAGVSLVSV